MSSIDSWKGLDITPEAFAQKMNEWAHGTMIENHGTRFLSAGGGRARAQLAFKPTLTQLTGLFHKWLTKVPNRGLKALPVTFRAAPAPIWQKPQ